MDMLSPTRMRAPVSCRALIVLSILLLAAHAPLLLNDGLFLDDWFLIKLRPDYIVDLDYLVHGAGHPVLYVYYSIANWTGAPVLLMQLMTLISLQDGAATSLDALLARLG
jgi:hypothetical protein